MQVDLLSGGRVVGGERGAAVCGCLIEDGHGVDEALVAGGRGASRERDVEWEIVDIGVGGGGGVGDGGGEAVG